MVYALADFGSTFTKVSLVDESSSLLASAQRPTTIRTDAVEGFHAALRHAVSIAGVARVERSLAASSAAGGLRMVAVGLVDDLTAAAAKRSALGAGAKVSAVLSGRLISDDAETLEAELPDVILFAGGIDGGERERVLANARAIAPASPAAAVVVACNRDIAAEVAAEFERCGHETVVCANVLPAVDREQSEPARGAIRDIFIRRVVRAKGLSTAEEFFDSVLMPTPSAVLAAAELLSRGDKTHRGADTLAIVDVGGATTDVHSVNATGLGQVRPNRSSPPPEVSGRTVEGDLGVRWSADGVCSQDEAWLVAELGLEPDELHRAADARKREPSFLPDTEVEREIDRALASSSIKLALERHTGRISTRYYPGEGAETSVDGRDLRDASLVIATGGAIARDAESAERTVRRALSRLGGDRPAPLHAAVLIDSDYILAAVGLLASRDEGLALRLAHTAIPGLGEAPC